MILKIISLIFKHLKENKKKEMSYLRKSKNRIKELFSEIIIEKVK